MANAIQVAPGYDNPGGLVTLDPQPDTDGITWPREINATDSTVYFDGQPFALLRFPDIETPADAVAALAQFGLSTLAVASQRITLRLPDEDKVHFSNYNGIAKRWNYGKDISFAYCWYEHPKILVRKLESI
jgi:hypothetical protein